MSGTFVAAYLLRLTTALNLRRVPSTARCHDLVMTNGPAPTNDPAVLVIPRGGMVRDPYLVVLARAGGAHEALPMEPTAADIHVRARIDASHDHGWQQMADVLVQPGKWPRRMPGRHMAVLLGRFPACEILTGHHGRGCLLGMRDGRTIAIAGYSNSRAAGDTDWPAVYGSVLHSWLSADMPLSTMEDAVVIAGHCDAGDGAITQLVVSGRAHIRVVSPQGRRHRSPRPPSSCQWLPFFRR